MHSLLFVQRATVLWKC